MMQLRACAAAAQPRLSSFNMHVVCCTTVLPDNRQQECCQVANLSYGAAVVQPLFKEALNAALHFKPYTLHPTIQIPNLKKRIYLSYGAAAVQPLPKEALNAALQLVPAPLIQPTATDPRPQLRHNRILLLQRSIKCIRQRERQRRQRPSLLLMYSRKPLRRRRMRCTSR
jgi:hypothetical protein